MIPEFDFITQWLAETFVHGTAILVIAIAALASIKQPARRMPVAWGAFAGLVALAILPALSWWPRIELPVWQSAAPIAAQAQDQPMASDEPGTRDDLDGQATFGSGIRENSDSPRRLTGILTNSATDDTTPTDPHLASDEPPRAELVVLDGPLPVPADAASKPQDMGAETKIERLTGTDVERAPFSWHATTTGLWLAGAFLVSVWIAAGAWRTQRLFGRSHAAPGWVRDDLRRIVPAHRREPTAWVSAEIAAALAYGAIRPAILLRDPQLRDAQSEPAARRGIRAALAHEYAHIAHGDLWLLALERLLLPVYFAHPLFWVLRRWIRIDQELLADAAAAADRPVEYAEALLEWAKSAPAAGSPRFAAALPLWSSPCHLKRRIEMLLDSGNPIARQASRLWRAAVTTTILSFVIGVSSVTFRPTSGIAQVGSDQPAAKQSANTASAAPVAAAPKKTAGRDTAENPRAKPAIAEEAPVEYAVDLPDDVRTPANDESGSQTGRVFRVQLNITMLQVDHEKLAEAGLMTLSRLTDETCVSFNKPRFTDFIYGVHTSTECGEKLIAALKACDAAKLETGLTALTSMEIRVNDKALISDFKYKPARLTLQLETRMTPSQPPNLGVLHVRLSVSGKQRPKADQPTDADRALEVSSTRKIGYASFLKAGQSLLIVDDSNDLESSLETDRVSLTIVSATSIEEIPIDQAQAGLAKQPGTSADRSMSAADATTAEPANHDADPKILLAEEAALQAKNKYDFFQRLAKKGYVKQSQADAERLAWELAQTDLAAAKSQALEPRDAANDSVSIEQQLLLLDVKEAEINLSVAKAAYDHAVEQQGKEALSASELAARKLALQKAEIALRRAKLRIEGVKSSSPTLKANPGPKAIALDEVDHTLTITITAAEKGQAAALALLSPKFNEGPMLAGRLNDQRLAALDRQLKDLVAIEGNPFNHVLIWVQKSLKHEDLTKVMDVCKKQKTALGNPFRISFVVMPEDPPEPDTDGAAKRESKAEERQITLRARVFEVPDSSLQQMRDRYSTVAKLNKFFAELANGKEAALTGILDAGDATMLNEFLDADDKAKVVVDSRVTVRSGHSARFLSKREIAVPTANDKDAERGKSISFRGAGISLFVVPTLQDLDLIRLQIVPEVTAIDVETTVDGIPGVKTQSLQTTVELRIGQAIASIGLLSSADSSSPRVLTLVTPEIVQRSDSRDVPNPEVREAGSPSSEPRTVEPKGGSSSRRVAATVNGRPVFVDDILRQLPREVADSLTKAEGELSPDEYRGVRRHILKPYIEVHIERELLLQSLTSKLKEGPLKDFEKQIGATFDAEILPLAMRHEAAMTQAEFERILRKRGSSIELLRMQFRNEELAQQYLGFKALPKTGFDRPDALNYYQEHKEDYAIPAQAKCEHIRLQFAKNGGKEGATKKATKIIERLKSGEDFAALAKECSDGPTASSRGGLRGWSTEGSLSHKKLARAVYEQPVGEIGPPIETDEAIEVVRVIERTPSGYRTFESVQDDIKMQLKKAIYQNATEVLINDLRQKATIEQPNSELNGASPKADVPTETSPASAPTEVNSATDHDDAFWLERKLEEQLAPLDSSVADMPLPAEPKFTPELEAILTAWAHAASRIERLQCTFMKFTYDHKHLVETRAEGSITVDAPDRAYYFVTAASLNGATESKRKRDGKAYALRTEDRDLAWMWAGGRVMHLDMRRKIYESAPLGDGNQPPTEDDQFFLARPFLLGMSVPNLTQRFAVTLKKRDEKEVWLSLIPRQSQSPAPYREAILILSVGDWHPRAVKLVDPRGDVESVHLFEQFVVNPPTSLTKQHLLDTKGLPGFREMTRSSDAARPWPVAPGTDAVFRSGQKRKAGVDVLDVFEMSAVRAAHADLPAALRSKYRGGVKVTAVLKGGIADAAGILPNDILVGLHFWEMVRGEDLNYAAKQIAAMDHFDKSLNADGFAVLLIRNGVVVKTKIKPKP